MIGIATEQALAAAEVDPTAWRSPAEEVAADRVQRARAAAETEAEASGSRRQQPRKQGEGR